MPDDGQVMTSKEAQEAAASLAVAARSGLPTDWARWALWLQDRSGREWLLLDEEARSWRLSGQAPVSGVRGWLSEWLDEPVGLVATVTSWHVDGRLRQRATQVLAARRGALAGAALAVRCLDHVPQVRTDALAGLCACVSRDEAVAVLKVLAAGTNRLFAPETLETYFRALSQQHDLGALLADLRVARDATLRRWAFARSEAEGLLSVDELVATTLQGTDQFLRAAAAGALRGRASTDQLLRLLGGRFVDGRLLALQELPDQALADETLLPLLADKSGRVRELAQWRAHRRGHDLAKWYRERLLSDYLGPTRIAACLDGLFSCGGPEAFEVAASFIAHPSPTVRAQAVTSVSAGAPATVVWNVLMPLLEDPAPRVSSAAARVLGRAGAGAAEAERAWVSALGATRRAAWRLTRAGGSWERVDADVRAAADPDPVLGGLGRAGLRNWLHSGAATTWGRPGPDVAERIQNVLPDTGLTPGEQLQLRFHADYQPPQAGRCRLMRRKRRPGGVG